MRDFVVRDSTIIHAPIERCFLLSTSIELVQRTLGLRPVPAESRRSAGLITAGDQLVWRGWKFGLPQLHETLITGFDEPRFFQDTMGRGRFAHFQHDHHFTAIQHPVQGSGDRPVTRLTDEVRFTMPLGWAGALIGRWVMVPHVRGLVRRRFALLNRIAAGDAWRQFLADRPDAA